MAVGGPRASGEEERWADRQFFHLKLRVLEFDDHQRPDRSKEVEWKLWMLCLQAAGPEHVLVPDQFATWIKHHRDGLQEWAEFTKYRSEELVKEQGLTKEASKPLSLGFRYADALSITPSGQELVNRCEGFKNFIKNYSLLAEREPVNVKLWDRLMVWAALLGVADQARKQFQRLYPEYLQQSLAFSDLVTADLLGSSVSSMAHLDDSDSLWNFLDDLGEGGSSSSSGGGGAGGGGSGGGIR